MCKYIGEKERVKLYNLFTQNYSNNIGEIYAEDDCSC